MSYILTRPPIQSGTLSAQATLSINFATVFNLYSVLQVFLISVVPVSNSVNMLCRVSVDGTTFDSGATNYKYAGSSNNDAQAAAAQGSTGATSIICNGASLIGNGATGGYNAIITLFNPGVATFKPKLLIDTVNMNASDANSVRYVGEGIRDAAQVTKGLQFLFDTGNISSGSWKLFGV